MTMIKYGPGITDINGKFGGVVYRWDQSFAHIQAPPRHIKRRTFSQDQIRKGFADLHYIFWRRMTPALREMWWEYSLQHPVKNKKGEFRILGRWPMFLHFNQPNWLLGIPPEWVPPGYTLPPPVQHDYGDWLVHWLFLWGG